MAKKSSNTKTGSFNNISASDILGLFGFRQINICNSNDESFYCKFMRFFQLFITIIIFIVIIYFIYTYLVKPFVFQQKKRR